METVKTLIEWVKSSPKTTASVSFVAGVLAEKLGVVSTVISAFV